LKSAIGFDFGELTNRPGVGDNVAVADDSAPAAAGSDQNQAGQESDRSLIHNSTLPDEMTSAPALDSYFLNLQVIG
jgi:hypothetical protein